jgi:hypothetical protein
MAYRDFSLSKLKNKFGIKQTKDFLFEKPLRKVEPSETLLSAIEDTILFPLNSEKAKSEAIIFPILREIIKKNKGKFTIFSGYSFDVDSSEELSGVCDYLLSLAPYAIEIADPIFCLVEAKNRTIEDGYGQCAAEMYAAKVFNEKLGIKLETIFGAVTNGNDWIFLKLEDNSVIIDNQLYGILDLPELLGALQNIVDFYD